MVLHSDVDNHRLVTQHRVASLYLVPKDTLLHCACFCQLQQLHSDTSILFEKVRHQLALHQNLHELLVNFYFFFYILYSQQQLCIA